ncbi:MAG TPA: alginate export family protein, partial [Nitrospirota bacterium]|nr:alginate export family protein [Nitrospirota bacterium]
GAGNFSFGDFGFTPGHGEGRFLYRVKPYAYWHPTDYLDFHLEGQWYGYTGTGEDSGRFDLYQGYVEAKLPGTDMLALKAGRQEFVYGSTFIIGSNSFYDGLVFDAVRLRLRPLEPLIIDLLAGWYAQPFDNGLDGSLAGAYATYAFSEDTAVEAYFFHDSGADSPRIGDYINIWGLRMTAALGPVSIELEPVYESGKVFNPSTLARDGINAYGGHLDLTCEAEPWGYHNQFLLGYAMGSGSEDAAEGISFEKEFRNPDNDTSLIGDMGFIGDLSGVDAGGHHASGLHVFTLGWGIDISEKLNFSATGHYFLADEVEDGFSRDIGTELDFTVTYNVNDNLSLIVGYDRFFTGGFFKDATGSGDDIDYGYAMLQFDFAKAKPRKL